MTQNKLVIGITGNSGSGKTTVAAMIEACGGYAINADIVAHRVMEPGKPAYKKIVAVFGPDILGVHDKIDRKKLGIIAFNDAKKRTQLEHIVHPLVIDEILAETAAADTTFVGIDAVLLVESGLHHHCDTVWLVTASAEARLARITTRDGLDKASAESRMRNQRSTQPIAAIAHVIIYNDGDLKSLQSQVDSAIGRYRNPTILR